MGCRTAYRDGEGTSQNMEEAFRWIKKAAQNDIKDAMFDTGLMCYRGEGTKMDVVDAFAWCKKAAENGVVNAMNCVGSFYRNGEGVMKDVKKLPNGMKGLPWVAMNMQHLILRIYTTKARTVFLQIIQKLSSGIKGLLKWVMQQQ